MNKNPVDGYMDNTLAAIFTMMLPGLGQMLKGAVISGLCWAVAVGSCYLLNGWLGLLVHVLCILNAAFGGASFLLEKKNWLRKTVLFSGLILLLTYTCLRTALF